MGGNAQTEAILKKAHETLDNANKFRSSATRQAGNKKDPFESKAASPPKTDYSHAHEARKSDEFMGIRSDEAPELNAALKAREDAKKALQQ